MNGVIILKGYCGIDCSSCDCFQATQENNDIKRMNVAIKWSRIFKMTILPREIECYGCKSDNKRFKNCDVCKIRKQHTIKASV